MAWPARGVLVLTVTLLMTGAAEAADSRLPPGPLYLDTPMVVGASETLTIGPDTVITGPGRIDVFGRLEVAGNDSARVDVSVPIRLLANATGNLSHVRLWGVEGAALLARNATLRLQDALLEANEDGVVLEGGRADLDRVRLLSQSGAALRQESGALRVANATIVDNGRGILLRQGALTVADSSFSRNGAHLDVDARLEASRAGAVRLARNDLGPALGTNAGIVLTGGPGNGTRIVEMEENRIHDSLVGARVTGPGVALVSARDAWEGNAVGIVASNATVTLRDGVLRNGEDMQGGAFQLNGTKTAAPPAAPQSGPTWLLPVGAALTLVLAGAIWASRLRLARRVPVREPAAPEPETPQRAPPAPEPPTGELDFSAQERRILQAFARQPDAAQAAVAEALGLSRQALHYHVKKLEARGLLTKTLHGRETRCRVRPDVVPLVLGEPEAVAPPGDEPRVSGQTP